MNRWSVELRTAPDPNRLAHDILAGLRSTPVSIPPKWFYDAKGSQLFDDITELPEYYPTAPLPGAAGDRMVLFLGSRRRTTPSAWPGMAEATSVAGGQGESFLRNHGSDRPTGPPENEE